MYDYLIDAIGVIHVGANVGQEMMDYAKYNLPVVWVEPDPFTYVQLVENIKDLPMQRAYNYLVTDVDGKEYDFHVTNNNGISSSIFQLKGHKEVLAWKDIGMVQTIKMISITLPSLLKCEKLDAGLYDVLVTDTQGADLLVLQGAISILPLFHHIQVEVADFEAYEGCCQLSDIEVFMRQNNYIEMSRFKFAWHPAGGSYFDIIYKIKH